MDSLIERLEKATEGSRELDAEIELASLPAYLVTKTPDGFVQVNRKGTALTPVWEDFNPWTVPHYTASLDAARSLIPPEWSWSFHGGKDVKPGAQLERLDIETPDGEIYALAATPALAVCIAALRARQQGEDNG